MLIIFIVLAVFAALSLATILEVIKERVQENQTVTLVTERNLKL